MNWQTNTKAQDSNTQGKEETRRHRCKRSGTKMYQNKNIAVWMEAAWCEFATVTVKGFKGDIGWLEEDVRMFWYLIYLCNRQEEDCVCVCMCVLCSADEKRGWCIVIKLFCSYSWKDTLIFNSFNHQHLNKGLWTENKRSYVIFWWSQIAFYLLYVCNQCWERLENVSVETS